MKWRVIVELVFKSYTVFKISLKKQRIILSEYSDLVKENNKYQSKNSKISQKNKT